MKTSEVYGYLEALDVAVIAAYLVFSVGLGILFARRGTKDAEAYFVGGRGIPWWVIGISLAATCFAADTPLWIGEVVFKRGIEATWLYWSTAIGFSFYVFTIAPLWRRSHIVTDLEFLELRYSGPAARWLRGFNSLYFALVFNVMMMAVSTLSISTIMEATTGLPKWQCVAITMSGALIYCVISGLWGVAATDFMQFFVAVIGSFVLAGFALAVVGGPGKLIAFLQSEESWAGHELNVMPGTGAAAGLPLLTILYIFLLRWHDNAGIGQYVSQRLFAARSTKEATWGAMLHSLVYWSIVPLPWIVTIAAARMYMPEMTDGRQVYPRMAMAVLPLGLKGLLVASMLAAFMSTYSTLLSWGSSYAVNDFYRRFVVKNAPAKHYVRVGQIAMIPMALISALIALRAESIFNLLTYLFLVPSAIYSVQVVRWLWWRVNAWAELAALLSGIFFTGFIAVVFPLWLHPDYNEQYLGHKFLLIMLGSLVVWVTVMFLTPPVEEAQIDTFARRVNPPGFWGPMRRRLGLPVPLTWGGIFYGWAIMAAAILGPAVGLVKICFGSTFPGVLLTAIGVVGIVLAVRRARRMDEDGFIHATRSAAVGARPERSLEEGAVVK